MHRVLVAVVGAFALSVATTAVAQHPHFGYAGEAAPAQMKEAFTVSKA